MSANDGLNGFGPPPGSVGLPFTPLASFAPPNTNHLPSQDAAAPAKPAAQSGQGSAPPKGQPTVSAAAEADAQTRDLISQIASLGNRSNAPPAQPSGPSSSRRRGEPPPVSAPLHKGLEYLVACALDTSESIEANARGSFVQMAGAYELMGQAVQADEMSAALKLGDLVAGLIVLYRRGGMALHRLFLQPLFEIPANQVPEPPRNLDLARACAAWATAWRVLGGELGQLCLYRETQIGDGRVLLERDARIIVLDPAGIQRRHQNRDRLFLATRQLAGEMAELSAELCAAIQEQEAPPAQSARASAGAPGVVAQDKPPADALGGRFFTGQSSDLGPSVKG